MKTFRLADAKTAAALAFLLIGTPQPPARANGNALAQTNQPPLPVTRFEDFAPLLHNNIFDAHRQDRARLDTEKQRSQQRPLPVIRFALVGTMHNQGKAFAFFTGTEPAFCSVRQTGQPIAGYTVAAIRDKTVTLSKEGKAFELAVGMEMRRQGEAEWQLGKNSSSSQTSAPIPDKRKPSDSKQKTEEKPPPLKGADDDILKQMMKRRQQELNK